MHIQKIIKNCCNISGFISGIEKSNVFQKAFKTLQMKSSLSEDVVQFSQKIKKYTPEDILNAYRRYEKSPHVNFYLRRKLPLSDEDKKLVECLEQAITESEPTVGKFYRGITADESEVAKYVFNNNGFTSTAPEINKNFAGAFAIGKHSAIVEFDLKEPIKGYKANNYEVLFKPNAFTSDKYEITKVKDGFYKVTEKSIRKTGCAKICSHYNEGNTIVFGQMPDDYVRKQIVFYPETIRIARFGPNKGEARNIPAHEEIESYVLPSYHIDKLWSGGAGTGTEAVQQVVKESLADSRTAGRVTLDACCIDGKTSPAGFYYKLGFRFKSELQNQNLEKWINSGGLKENAPFETGIMYLPKEKIEQCISYVPKK